MCVQSSVSSSDPAMAIAVGDLVHSIVAPYVVGTVSDKMYGDRPEDVFIDVETEEGKVLVMEYDLRKGPMPRPLKALAIKMNPVALRPKRGVRASNPPDLFKPASFKSRQHFKLFTLECVVTDGAYVYTTNKDLGEFRVPVGTMSELAARAAARVTFTEEYKSIRLEEEVDAALNARVPTAPKDTGVIDLLSDTEDEGEEDEVEVVVVPAPVPAPLVPEPVEDELMVVEGEGVIPVLEEEKEVEGSLALVLMPVPVPVDPAMEADTESEAESDWDEDEEEEEGGNELLLLEDAQPEAAGMLMLEDIKEQKKKRRAARKARKARSTWNCA